MSSSSQRHSSLTALISPTRTDSALAVRCGSAARRGGGVGGKAETYIHYGLWNLCLTIHKPEEAYVLLGAETCMDWGPFIATGRYYIA